MTSMETKFAKNLEEERGLHKTFWGTTKKYENKNLSPFLFYYNFLKCTGRDGLTIWLVLLWMHLQIYYYVKYKPLLIDFFHIW